MLDMDGGRVWMTAHAAGGIGAPGTPPPTYTTIAGDTFDLAAYKALGDGRYTDKVIKLNPGYREIVTFPAGVTLILPEKTDAPAAGLPPWRKNILSGG
jgi:phage tail protein X